MHICVKQSELTEYNIASYNNWTNEASKKLTT